MFGSDSDEILVTKAQKGSQRSWVKLVKRYEKRIYNYCIRMTFNDADASELMQEIFLAIYRNSPNYSGTGTFSGWIFGIASNKTIDFLRGRQRNPLFNADEFNEDNSFHHIDSIDELSNSRDNKRVLIVMSRLPADQRLVVELKFFQQMTFDEISSHTGIPVSTVKSRLYAALRIMKNHLEIQHAV